MMVAHCLQDRDISEKIALGLADPRAGRGNDGQTMFDDRLFNQTKVCLAMIMIACPPTAVTHYHQSRVNAMNPPWLQMSRA